MKLPPSANPGATSSGNSQSEVQAILVDFAVQTDIHVQEDEKLKKQVCKQRWKLLLKLLNLQTTKQVTIRMILLSKVKMNTKQSIAILGTRAFFCNSIF